MTERNDLAAASVAAQVARQTVEEAAGGTIHRQQSVTDDLARLIELKPCPFCGEALVSYDGLESMFHPGVVTDDSCILSGRGFLPEDWAAWNRRSTQVDEAPGRERAALQAILDGTFPRPVGKRWHSDGSPSKHDMCEHGVWMYETCGNCIDAFVLAALVPHPAPVGEKHD